MTVAPHGRLAHRGQIVRPDGPRRAVDLPADTRKRNISDYRVLPGIPARRRGFDGHLRPLTCL